MTSRRHRGDQSGASDVNFTELRATDEFVDAISSGVDPSNGTDDLAGNLLAFREEIYRDIPRTPSVRELGVIPAQDDPTSVFPPISTHLFAPEVDSALAEETSAEVIDLGHRRYKFGRIASGLVGAAAATLIIAGGGITILNADETSPLYGLYQQLFGTTDQAAVVELASTLEEVDSRNNLGDTEGARQLLEQARSIVERLNDSNRAQARIDIEKRTVTVTVTPPPVTEVTTTTVTLTPEPSVKPHSPATTVTPSPQGSASPSADNPASSTVPQPDAPAEPRPAQPLPPLVIPENVRP
ncbi:MULTISPECIES: hypothetical protein [unclassified Corynebacterium]|uniref:hypothetical protein n=1 Tax=unclassified Corynebacterium TaxID=2624378 RepID=UPI00216894A3|nr:MULTISPECIES: hypothetical protein [unclassified Corynebacterium]MCS4489565.1 hypothetical protein [Corynebacterium sp. ES2775-CONJ]MCS4531475.1 hypothetical protein [Corynebacterium sp. ES2730-CONJ]